MSADVLHSSDKNQTNCYYALKYRDDCYTDSQRRAYSTDI
jgi:hypothetical protein